MRARTHLTEPQAKDWIGRYGISTPTRRVAKNADEAVRAFEALRPPLAVKLVSQAIHKSEVGGVRLGVSTAAELDDAIAAIDRAAADRNITVEAYLLEEMAPKGVEILVGGIVDAVFGPAVVVGLGGVYTEIFDDVAARICPISKDEALEMIGEIKAAPLLFGARGAVPLDVKGLADVLIALGGPTGLLVEHAERIREIDLNPVIVSPTAAVAVDARLILRMEASGDR